jgi:hypothetical protein
VGYGNIKRGLLRVVPNRLFESPLAVLADVDQALKHYVRGILLACCALDADRRLDRPAEIGGLPGDAGGRGQRRARLDLASHSALASTTGGRAGRLLPMADVLPIPSGRDVPGNPEITFE